MEMSVGAQRLNSAARFDEALTRSRICIDELEELSRAISGEPSSEIPNVKADSNIYLADILALAPERMNKGSARIINTLSKMQEMLFDAQMITLEEDNHDIIKAPSLLSPRARAIKDAYLDFMRTSQKIERLRDEITGKTNAETTTSPCPDITSLSSVIDDIPPALETRSKEMLEWIEDLKEILL